MKPVGKRLLVKQVKEDVVNGLILPEDKNSQKMLVVSISEDDSSSFKVGDVVLLEKYAGQPVTVNGDELFVVKEEQVIAVY